MKQIKIASFTLSTIAIVFFLAGCADDSSTNPVVIVPPTAPSGLSATMVSWSAVRLSWTDNSQDEEGFRVYQKEGVGNWSVTDTTGKNTTTVLVSGLTPETGYSFRVQSYKGNTGSSNSDSVSVLTSKEGVIYGYQFIKIPAGSFNMGSDSGKPYEKPVHLVTIAYDFWMMETEVTQKQWTAVTGSNPSFWKGDSLPVESVTWQECKNFIDSLNTLYPGKGFRFPTEAEWEYAARAGTDTFFPMGNDSVACGRAGWYRGNSGSHTHPVKLREPNGFGLYDMIGNVSEWIADWWHDDYTGAPTDGSEWKDPPELSPSSVWRVHGGHQRM